MSPGFFRPLSRCVSSVRDSFLWSVRCVRKSRGNGREPGHWPDSHETREERREYKVASLAGMRRRRRRRCPLLSLSFSFSLCLSLLNTNFFLCSPHRFFLVYLFSWPIQTLCRRLPKFPK